MKYESVHKDGQNRVYNMSINLKEIIFKALEEQRERLIVENTKNAEDWVFSEEDIVEEALFSLGLTLEDIDSNDFRDYQNETVALCNKIWEQTT